MRLIVTAFVAATALVGLTGVAAACPGEMAAQPEKKAFAYVSTEDFKAWHAKGDATIIDANKAETFAKNHVPGALHQRYDAVNAKVLPQSKDAKIVAYCYSEQCSASHKWAEAAAKLGYTNLFVYAPGIQGWMKAGLPVAQAKASKAKTGA